MELVPKDSISLETRASIPETKAAITITVIVPMTTPSTVRAERSLCCHRVSNPMRTFSSRLPFKRDMLMKTLGHFPFVIDEYNFEVQFVDGMFAELKSDPGNNTNDHEKRDLPCWAIQMKIMTNEK